MRRLVRNRLRGEKIFDEAAGIRIQKLLNPLLARGFKNKSGVMKLVDAVHDLLVGVRRSIGVFLARQRKNHSRVITSFGWKSIRLLPRTDFQASPLAPEIDAGGSFDDIGDVRAPDARSYLKKAGLESRVRVQRQLAPWMSRPLSLPTARETQPALPTETGTLQSKLQMKDYVLVESFDRLCCAWVDSFCRRK